MIAYAAPLLLFAVLVTAGCPDGSIYDTNFNKCYEFVKTLKTFMDSEQYCVSLGGHLVEVQNAFENSYIAALAVGAGVQSFRIGANLIQSVKWTWTTTGNLLNYTNWASGEPIQASRAQSAYLTVSNQLWNTASTNQILPFICNMSPNLTLPCTSLVETYCPKGYYLHNGNCMCYKYVKNANLTFTEAKDACVQDGGLLATVPSRDVNDFLTALSGLQNATNYELPYIGLSCSSYAASSCTWADGSPLGSYSNFYASPQCPCVLNAGLGLTSGQWVYGQWAPWNTIPHAYICQKGSYDYRPPS